MESLALLVTTGMVCGSIMMIAFMILLSLPQSKLRSVGMEVGKWAMVLAFGILLISPIDFIPDVIPLLGWGDDIGYIVAGIAAAQSALKERRERQLIED